MKKKFLLLTVFSFLLAIILSGLMNEASSFISGGPPGCSGSPGDAFTTCARSGCHTGAPVETIAGMITSNVPGIGYTPGNTYTITGTMIRAGHSRFGFEISPQNTSGVYLGTLVVTNSTETQITGTKYITHRSGGMIGSGSRTWTFNWVAPVAGTGTVNFYGCFNATNSSNTALGDTVAISTLVINENPAGIYDPSLIAESVSVFPNPAHETFNLHYSLKKEELVEIQLFDMNGKSSLLSHNSKRTAGDHRETYSLPAGLPAGLYFIQLKAGSDKSSQKLIVR